MHKDDEPPIGYCSPPEHGRFKPGKSGNPKGRPKGSKNFNTVIAKELNDRIPITENGKRRKISKREAIAKQVINKAAGGDLKAAQTLLSHDRALVESTLAPPDPALFDRPEHRLVMHEIVRRIRAAQPPPENPERSIHSDETAGTEDANER